MAASNQWHDLSKQIEELRYQFLPPTFDPLGVYADGPRVQAHARAFLIFSHAEIQSYLEGLAKEIAKTAEAAWLGSQKLTAPLAFMIATMGERIVVPQKLLKQGTNDVPTQFNDVLVKLFSDFYAQVKSNNGIKEFNVLMLFGPLGLPSVVLGSTLLPNLDSLGLERGTYAHKSGRAVINTLDPEIEYKRVVNLVHELEDVDDWFVAYLNSIP
jgi:hypothetical protein